MKTRIQLDVYSGVEELDGTNSVNAWIVRPDKAGGILRFAFYFSDLDKEEKISEVVESAAQFVRGYFGNRGFCIEEKRSGGQQQLCMLVCASEYKTLIKSISRKKWGMKRNYRYCFQQGYLHWMQERGYYMKQLDLVENQKLLKTGTQQTVAAVILLFLYLSVCFELIDGFTSRILYYSGAVLIGIGLELLDRPGGFQLRKKNTN